MSYPWGTDIWDHPDPITMSHSSDGIMAYCWRKFEFYKFYKHYHRDFSVEGSVGNAMHAALQEFMVNGNEDKAYFRLMMEYPLIDNPEIEDVRSLEACYITLQAILRTPKFHDYELAKIVDIHGVTRDAVEVEFEIWIDGIFCEGRPFVYRGFIDAILYNKRTGGYLVIDLKTTRKEDRDLVAEFKFDTQCVPYAIVLQGMLGKNIEEFTIMYINAYIDIIKPVITLQPFVKKQSDVQDWATTLYLNLLQIIQFKARNYFPRRQHGCVGMFNKPCWLLDVCEERNREALEKYLLAEGEKGGTGPKERKPWVRFVLPLTEKKHEDAS